MKRFRRPALAVVVGLAFASLYPMAQAQTFTWTTVVNNGDLVPACGESNGTRHFNSYGQPSVNEYGLVVFRGRSKGADGGGGEGEVFTAPEGVGTNAETGPPARGIYVRDVRINAPVSVVACVGGTVPQPNNLDAPFNEFPAFPRMDASSPAIATRGQSRPVWEYQTGIDSEGKAITTRVGTSGVYTNPGGLLTTGASLLGAVRTYPSTALTFPAYSVPGAPAGTRFDQFPGSPTVTAGTVIGFKGNYTDVVGRTGVFFRDVSRSGNATYLVANSLTRIPNQPAGTNVLFGSTAPPSAAYSNEGFAYMYFVGLDNEEAPTMGGIYRAKMKDKESQKLETLVGIGSQVPGEAAGVGFARIGEGLSVSADANFVTFWGAWGAETFSKTLLCPKDGNADLKKYCNDNYPAGLTVQIPKHQGIFAYDVKKKEILRIARTGADGLEDFLYWVFSGAPPGVGGGHEGGEEDGDESREPPRWRSSAFAAVSLTTKKAYAVAFKGTQDLDYDGATPGTPGIFLRKGTAPLATVVKVGDSGNDIDNEAPKLSDVTAVGIERDGFRGTNLAITASMLWEDLAAGESVGWAGVYVTQVPLAD